MHSVEAQGLLRTPTLGKLSKRGRKGAGGGGGGVDWGSGGVKKVGLGASPCINNGRAISPLAKGCQHRHQTHPPQEIRAKPVWISMFVLPNIKSRRQQEATEAGTQGEACWWPGRGGGGEDMKIGGLPTLSAGGQDVKREYDDPSR